MPFCSKHKKLVSLWSFEETHFKIATSSKRPYYMLSSAILFLSGLNLPIPPAPAHNICSQLFIWGELYVSNPAVSLSAAEYIGVHLVARPDVKMIRFVFQISLQLMQLYLAGEGHRLTRYYKIIYNLPGQPASNYPHRSSPRRNLKSHIITHPYQSTSCH